MDYLETKNCRWGNVGKDSDHDKIRVQLRTSPRTVFIFTLKNRVITASLTLYYNHAIIRAFMTGGDISTDEIK